MTEHACVCVCGWVGTGAHGNAHMLQSLTANKHSVFEWVAGPEAAKLNTIDNTVKQY